MPPAARVGDPTNHPGAVTGPGVPTVLIGGQPAAALGDLHTCGNPSGHPPTPFVIGSPTVFIGGRSTLRMGDTCGCGAQIAMGMLTVLIG